MTDPLSRLSIDHSKRSVQTAGQRKWRRYAIVLLLIGLVLWLHQKGYLTRPVTVTAVKTTLVYPSQSLTLLNASGYVVAQRKAAVASKTTGRLVELLVEEGSRVKKGDIIARLENDDALAAQAQAEANLKAAEANARLARADLQDAELNFNRSKKLVSGSSIAQYEYDAAEIRFRKAKASVEAADASVKAMAAAVQSAVVALDYTLIKAPFDAVVLTKNADIGDIVTPIGAASDAKAAVVSIADMDSFQVEVDVSETNINRVSVGQPCEIQIDAIPDIRLPGRVHMIVPTVDRSKATIMVKVAFIEKDTRLFPDMSAKVAFLSRPITEEERSPKLSVAEAAVVNRADQPIVFGIQADRVVEKRVRTGVRLGDMIEIKEGLTVGDRVVLQPLEKLAHGMKIRIEEK